MAKVALITGGASGMGRVFSLRMAHQGFRVAVVDMNEALMAELSAQSEQITCYSCDVSDCARLEDTIRMVEGDLGAIDRLVTCAAVMPTSRLAEQRTREIHSLMRINYGGTVNATQAVLPKMLERNCGEIVIFGSTGGSVLVPECGAYCASKAATNAYAEILMQENRETNLHIMLVCPPLVDTPLLEQATRSSNPKNIQYSIKNKRFVSPEFVINEVEKGLAKRKAILLPGMEAKIVMGLRRLSPALLWKIIRLSNR